MAYDFTNENQRKRWDAARTAGRRAYILKVGVLGWGLPVALAVTAVDRWRGEPWSELWVTLAIRLVIFGIGGIAFGAAMWRFSQWFFAGSVAAPAVPPDAGSNTPHSP